MYDSLMVDYDNVLIGRTEKINPDHFFGANQASSNQRQALKCVRYALEDVLNWDEETSVKKFDTYMINAMKLKSVIKYIDFPPEFKENDPRYILSLLYPALIKFNNEKLIYEVFERVQAGEDKQFPRDYFLGGLGLTRFCYCIKYIIEKDLVFSEIPQIYDFFLSSKGRQKLLDCRLRTPAYQYDIDIIEVIYTITFEYPDAEMWYCYYSFLRKLDELEHPTRKKKKISIKKEKKEEENVFIIPAQLEAELGDGYIEDVSNLTEEELLKKIKKMEDDMDEEK